MKHLTPFLPPERPFAKLPSSSEKLYQLIHPRDFEARQTQLISRSLMDSLEALSGYLNWNPETQTLDYYRNEWNRCQMTVTEDTDDYYYLTVKRRYSTLHYQCDSQEGLRDCLQIEILK